MQLPSKRWSLAAPISGQVTALFPDLPPLLVQLLSNRGICTPDAARSFLSQHPPTHDPFKLKGMDAAVTRLRLAMRRGEPIAIYGDFDADGVTATVLLVQVLSGLGANVTPYIPHRVNEGYGLHLDALRTLYRRGVRVVVTVDCGVRSIDVARRAGRGLDLIITDHHSPGGELPQAVAVINPKQPGCSYPFNGLAGVGLAYKLAQALRLVDEKMKRAAGMDEESLLDLVALGTVCDLVPLLDENRGLLQRGLVVLNDAPRCGLEALMADAALRRGVVDSTAIGFRLGPRLNAAGRLDSAMIAYQLLTSNEPLETQALAAQLGELNRRRQELTEQTVAEAEAEVLSEQADAALYLVASPSFLPGIVGLAASRLTETYYRPSIVVQVGEQESRGSCRSIPEFDITQGLDLCADLLIRYGGHAAAAGFTICTSKLGELRLRLQSIAAGQLAGAELWPVLKIDAQVPLAQVNWATHSACQQLQPCGTENPQAVLLSRGLTVREARAIGSEGQHLRLTLGDSAGVAWEAVFFRHGSMACGLPARVDVAYTLEAHEWGGERRLQLNVQDMRPADGARPGIDASLSSM